MNYKFTYPGKNTKILSDTKVYWSLYESDGVILSEPIKDNKTFKFNVTGTGKAVLGVMTKSPPAKATDLNAYFSEHIDILADIKLDGSDKWYQIRRVGRIVQYQDSNPKQFDRSIGNIGSPIWACLNLQYGTIQLKASHAQFSPVHGANVTYGDHVMLKDPYPFNETRIEPCLSLDDVIKMEIYPQKEGSHTPVNCHCEVAYSIGETGNVNKLTTFYNGWREGEMVYQCEENHHVVIKLIEGKLQWKKYGPDPIEGGKDVPSGKNVYIFVRPFRTCVSIVHKSPAANKLDMPNSQSAGNHPGDLIDSAYISSVSDPYCTIPSVVSSQTSSQPLVIDSILELMEKLNKEFDVLTTRSSSFETTDTSLVKQMECSRKKLEKHLRWLHVVESFLRQKEHCLTPRRSPNSITMDTEQTSQEQIAMDVRHLQDNYRAIVASHSFDTGDILDLLKEDHFICQQEYEHLVGSSKCDQAKAILKVLTDKPVDAEKFREALRRGNGKRVENLFFPR